MDGSIYDLSILGWSEAVLCALILGMSKCGLAGLGSLAVPLMAMVLPARASTGALLPIIILGDICGASCFHKHSNWRLLVKVFPSAVAGVVIGYFLMRQEWMNDLVIRKLIGVIVAIMAVLSILMKSHPITIGDKEGSDFRTLAFATLFGIIAGVTTLIANAAGPVTMMYLLMMKLPKDEFIGTSAWYCVIMNWVKVPFMVHLGLINGDSLLFDAKLVPALLVGAALGYWGVKRLSEKSFRLWVQILTIAAALKLLF